MSDKIHPSKLHGRLLKRVNVYPPGKHYKTIVTNTKLPSSHYLFNFDVKAGKQSWTVLDNYGDEILTDNIRKILFNTESWQNIAIDKSGGEIYICSFENINKSLTMNLWPLVDSLANIAKVPQKYLLKLDSLKTQKRPYAFTLRSKDLMEYIDHDITNQYLQNNVVVEINFPDTTIQVWGDTYREIGKWIKT